MIQIISYGNSLREDDGGGLLLGALFKEACLRRSMAVELHSCHQLAPELVLEIIRPDVTQVVFTDTRIVTAGSSGGVVEIEPITPVESGPVVGHHLTPGVLLMMAEKLYQHPVAGWQATVPGSLFGHGEQLSALTRKALAEAPERIDTFLDRLHRDSFR